LPVGDHIAAEVHSGGAPRGGRVREGALQVLNTPVGEWENTGVSSCGDTQVRHSVPDGGHSGAAQKGQEENVGNRAHLDREGQLLSSWLSKAN